MLALEPLLELGLAAGPAVVENRENAEIVHCWLVSRLAPRDVGAALGHAELPAANLGEQRDARADFIVGRAGEAKPDAASAVGLVDRPFRSRVDVDAGGERGLAQLHGIDFV